MRRAALHMLPAFHVRPATLHMSPATILRPGLLSRYVRPIAVARIPRAMSAYSTYSGVNFEQIQSTLEIHRPTDHVASAPIVLVLGWMDGEMRHVSKYALPYTELCPGSTIVMQTVDRWNFLYRHGEQEQCADKLIDALPQLTDGSCPRVIVHSFSNGGLGTLNSFFRRMHARNGSMFPVGNIMDCSPGRMTPDADEALLFGTEKSGFMQRTATRMFVKGLNAYRRLSSRITGRPEMLDGLRQISNNPKAWMRETLPPRIYMYTESDIFIAPGDVESHAREALAKHRKDGVPLFEPEKNDNITWPPLAEKPVRLCRWHSPTHVSIGRKDPKTYWGNIKKFIDEASDLPVDVHAKL